MNNDEKVRPPPCLTLAFILLLSVSMFTQYNLQYSHSLKILKVLLLTLSLVIFSTISIYASDIDFPFEDSSAIGGSGEKVIDDSSLVKAASSDTIVAPSSSTGTIYYYYASTDSVRSTTSTISSWGQLVSALTQSFAYNTSNLASTFTSPNVSITWPSIGYYYSPTTTDNGVNVNFSIANSVGLQAINNQISEMFRETWRYQYRMFKYFMPSVDQLTDNWNGPYYRRRVQFDGSYILNTINNQPSIIKELADFMYDSLFNQYNLARRIYSGVKESASADEAWNSLYSINNGNEIVNPSPSLWADIRYINRYLTHLDSRLVRMPSGANYYLYDKDHNQTSVSPSSMYDYMRRLGNNLSDNISRLAYVLANDKDIALRQANENNVDSVVNNFTDSNSLTPAKINNVKGIGNDLSSGLSSNASISDGTSILNGDSHAWSWFTSDTASSLDNVPNMRKSKDIEYYYINNYEKDLNKYVGESVKSHN